MKQIRGKKKRNWKKGG
ncbi:hypothetical protein [Spiroplasma kunkelii]|nr:hypothetical protein [Spiroplasma kunkelii]